MPQQATIQNLVEYQRRCYEADNRETGIINLRQPKNRHVRFLDGVESAICGTLPRVALPQEYAEKLRKETYQYRRDKSLIYGTFAIVGNAGMYDQLPPSVCAPLLYVACDFEENKGSIFLTPDLESVRINYPALAQIAEATGADREKLEIALATLPPLPWDREKLHSVAAKLAEQLPAVDFTPLSAYPQLVSIRGLQSLLDSNIEQLQCQPTATIALIPNSPETRGVLYELEQLGNQTRFSKATEAVLRTPAKSQPTPRSPIGSPRWPITPSVLSEAQLRVIEASASQPITLVVGPPGTGKSHTIASIALDHLARNETVLVASRMDQAVNVVASKIESLIGTSEAVVRAGRKEHMRELKSKLSDLLQGIVATPTPSGKSAKQLKRALAVLQNSQHKIELNLTRQMDREVQWGAYRVNPPTHLLPKLAGTLNQSLREWFLGDTNIWQQVQTYLELLEERSSLVREYLRTALQERIQRLLKKRRAELTKFLQAIRARSDGKQQDLFAEIDFSTLLHTFPVWLCKLTDLANVLPLQPELFDVAILDEATQCDIASCLPLFHRAKRVVIVGDPKQLRHISFLAETRNQSIASELELSAQQFEQFHFRRKSILDAVSDSVVGQQQVVFLNEHFRSLPGIIGFSNRNFYNGALTIMRDRPATARIGCVQICRTLGRRDGKGRNQVEAEQLVDDLVDRIQQNRSSAPGPEAQPTIGVLSPFREQVDLLTQMINQRLTLTELERHELLVGTAHSFQGEERDLMYLSWAVDKEAHSATWRYLNSPEILNVSVTRARNLQLLYTSFDPMQLPPQTLLRQLFTDTITPQRTSQERARSIDPFRFQVIEQCTKAGWQTWKDYPIAGQLIDLIIETPKAAVAVDLVGYPGQLAEAYPLERYRVIQRAGIDLLPLSYRDWLNSQELAIERIKLALGMAEHQAPGLVRI